MARVSSLFSSSVATDEFSIQQKSLVTYALSSLTPRDEVLPSITLLESRNLLAAGGTTGLRTWEAALHLGEYLCASYSNLIRDNAILELGSGTGYISILCAKYLGAAHVISTDGSDDVVTSLTGNFKLNGIQDTSVVDAEVLKWGDSTASKTLLESNKDKKIDLILGADVTYDESAIIALTATFEDFFEMRPGVRIIIAATLRNEKTFSFFREACAQKSYQFEEIDSTIQPGSLQMGPFYPDNIPIRICLISRP